MFRTKINLKSKSERNNNRNKDTDYITVNLDNKQTSTIMLIISIPKKAIITNKMIKYW